MNGKESSQSPYLSEWGPTAFNAAVRTYNLTSSLAVSQGPVVKADITLKALFDLALGRSSTLYTWDDRRKTFLLNYKDISSSGYTSLAFSGISKAMVDCGSSIKRLRKFAERTYSSRDIPSRVALANAVSTVLSGIEIHLTSNWPQLRTLLQLQSAVEKPRNLLQQMLDLVIALRSARTDEQISSIMFNWCRKIEHESTWLSSIMFEVLSRISNPLLERMDGWVGFPSRAIMGHSQSLELEFITANDTQEAEFSATQYTLDKTLLPAFISTDIGEVIMEVGLGLKLLQRHHPSHVLAQPQPQVPDICLGWKQSWSDIDSVVEKAQIYEQELAAAVRQYASTSVLKTSATAKSFVSVESHDLAEADCESAFSKALQRFDESPLESRSEHDGLLSLVQSRMDEKILDEDILIDQLNTKPSIDLLAVLSFSPLLTAQARLVRGACLRTLFRSHDVRTHLRVQRSFHLMGDGVFVSRLSAALFDSTAATTERQLGVMRSGTGMGLKLSNRKTWPPASSELRLALMGILNECYQASSKSKRRDEKQRDIPGGLSFAIRSLAEDEVARIMDPHSLHALDFLRLQYSAPSPIDTVITSLSLDKYDLIFKFLLRLVRLLFVVSRFPIRGAKSSILIFCNQARHFVNACAQHFFNTAVGETWSAFDTHLDSIVASLGEEDALNSPMMRDIGGIEDLRRRHEECLNTMLFGLLLRHRQTKIMALLEEIFTMVLGLETLCRAELVQEAPVKKLHTEFVDKVSIFLEVCRGLSGKKGYGMDNSQGNTVERLVIAVDFNEFYSSRRRR